MGSFKTISLNPLLTFSSVDPRTYAIIIPEHCIDYTPCTLRGVVYIIDNVVRRFRCTPRNAGYTQGNDVHLILCPSRNMVFTQSGVVYTSNGILYCL